MRPTSGIRYWGDKKASEDRLFHHRYLRPTQCEERKFIISSFDNGILGVLSTSALYAPFQELIEEPIEVIANEGYHETERSWLGFQEGNRIDLYMPSFQNVSTLIFTFFHEYGHWIHKQHSLVSDDVWESFLAACGNTNPSSLFEDFANQFAWYCTNPNYLRIERPKVYELFMEFIHRHGANQWGTKWEQGKEIGR